MSDTDVKGAGPKYDTPLLPTQFDSVNVCAATHIGRRKNQEDRFVFCPMLFGGEFGFYGVFDGTVQEHASQWVHKNIVSFLLQSPSFCTYQRLTPEQKKQQSNWILLEKACTETYATTDAALIEWCAEKELHYTSCTSVTALIHFPTQMLYTAHLGDSHIVIGAESVNPENGERGVVSRSVTRSHKPDDKEELSRIRAAGGSLVYLKSGKPFLRGGDFFDRELAMQLNYSRAFGGKDLKGYGLSSVPTVSRFSLKGDGETGPIVSVLLGSDGIWDVLSPSYGVSIAFQARMQYEQWDAKRRQAKSSSAHSPRPLSPAERLLQVAMDNQLSKNSNDNVTAIVVFLPVAPDSSSASSSN